MKLSDELHRLFDKRMHITVIIDERHHLAVMSKDFFDSPRLTERTTELESLSRSEKLDGKNALGVLHHTHKLGSRIRTHAHMILLTL